MDGQNNGGEPTPRQRMCQNNIALNQRAVVTKWMMDRMGPGEWNRKTVFRDVSKKLPDVFRTTTNADCMRAWCYWNERWEWLADLDMDDAQTRIVSSTKSKRTATRRVQMKSRPGRGRRPALWVQYLHQKLLSEFKRLTGVEKFNSMKEKHGVPLTRKAMIHCGLGLPADGQWRNEQLTQDLQRIVERYPDEFAAGQAE